MEKVNHPSHYNTTGKETIEIMKEISTHEEFVGFLKNNVVKYVHRYRNKNGKEDLDKAIWYLRYLRDYEYPQSEVADDSANT